MVQASPETVAIWKHTRSLGKTPSIFWAYGKLVKPSEKE